MTTFLTEDGREYTTDDPIEVTRLQMSARFTEKGVTPHSIDDARFHPDQHKAEEVKAYIEANPAEAERVLAEEKAGKARKALVEE